MILMCQFSPENDLPTHKNLKFWSLVTSYFLLTPNIYKTFDNRNKEKGISVKPTILPPNQKKIF